MACECISKAKLVMQGDGVILETGILLFNNDMQERPVLKTRHERGGRRKDIFPSFCPFCGVKYIEGAK